MSPANFDTDFYIRCVLSLVAGLSLLAAGAPVAEKRYQRSPPTWFVILLFFARILMLSASFLLGAAAGVGLASVLLAGNTAAPVILALALAVGGVWSITILSQMLANLVRVRLGLKPYKLELWRK
jgi:hypothetical protein